AAKAVLRAGQLPAFGERFGDHEPHVVTRSGMLATGISQPNDQPVDGSATATEGASQRPLLPAGGALRLAALAARLALALADELGLGLDLLGDFGLQPRRRQRRDDRLLGVVEQHHALG